jgi:hypothetical protein
LRRRLASEPVEPFRYDRTPHLDTLARKAARWCEDNVDRISTADPDLPAGIYNRVADNWRPLLSIADVAGGAWPQRGASCPGRNGWCQRVVSKHRFLCRKLFHDSLLLFDSFVPQWEPASIVIATLQAWICARRR